MLIGAETQGCALEIQYDGGGAVDAGVTWVTTMPWA